MFSLDARRAQGVRSFESDGVVVGRVDARVRDAHVAAGIDIDAVAVGVDHDVVDGQIVHAGGKDSEMAAIGDGEIAQRHVAAELQRDGLVAARSAAAIQRLAGYASTADDRDILQTLAPNQAVVKVAVAGVLKLIPFVRFRRVIRGRVAARFDHRSALQLQRDITAQADRARNPCTWRDDYCSTAGRSRSVDGLVDRLAALRFAIAFRAVGGDVENSCLRHCRLHYGRRER